MSFLYVDCHATKFGAGVVGFGIPSILSDIPITGSIKISEANNRG